MSDSCFVCRTVASVRRNLPAGDERDAVFVVCGIAGGLYRTTSKTADDLKLCDLHRLMFVAATAAEGKKG